MKSESTKHKFEFFDQETLTNANWKLDRTEFALLYPDFIFNDTALDNYYQKVLSFIITFFSLNKK